jgi:DNA-binding transcriptional LysR family regulator
MRTDLDLNLLHALHALLTEQHVTRAGRRVGLSQPAMSAALARLRRYFDDELLIRNGNRYHLTPVATELLVPLERVMALVGETLAIRQPFDPSASQRELTVQLSDYALLVIVRPLLAAAHAEAPGVHLRFAGLERGPTAATPPADLVISPTLRPDDGSPELWADDWLMAVADGHPDVGERATVEQLSELTYVRFQIADIPSAADVHLAREGVSLHVGTTVASFTGALHLLRGTRWYTLAPRRLVAASGPAAGVRGLPCPVPLPPIVERLYCAGHREGDAAVAWLHDLICRVAAEL